MASQAISKLGVGPLSSEVVEATFRYAADSAAPLMLIASKNQIDWDGGYVERWNTRQYALHVQQLRKKYPKATVYLCRDHCGPGFKNNDPSDVYKTIDDDIENGFDLIHIDFSRDGGAYEDMLLQSEQAIQYIQKKSPETLIEVGTEEPAEGALTNIDRVEEELRYFTSVSPIHFFVLQTGSLVKEMQQVGTFDDSYVSTARQIAEKYNVYLKEHNADYLTAEELERRNGRIDAINVAPQYGVLQTMITLQKAQLYNIDASDFLNDAYGSRKWQKWLHRKTADDRHVCALLAGHYVFSGDAYRTLYEKISRHEDLREYIMQQLIKQFARNTIAD